MHRHLGGGLQRALQHPAFRVYEHHVLRLQERVVAAARGDEYVSLGGAVADVARGPGHEARDAYTADDPGHLFAEALVLHDN
jgi:hypothetical protein